MPNTIDEVAATLERQFVLRRFNKDFLSMEINSGSMVNRLIGMGERVDKETGKTERVVNFYPSYHRNVVKTFELFPVHQFFGINVQEAMNLPVDQWYHIRKAAERLGDHKKPDIEMQLLEIIKGMSGGRGGEE